VEDWPVEKWIRYDQDNAARRKSIRSDSRYNNGAP